MVRRRSLDKLELLQVPGSPRPGERVFVCTVQNICQSAYPSTNTPRIYLESETLVS
jgi:hypothetical protein